MYHQPVHMEGDRETVRRKRKHGKTIEIEENASHRPEYNYENIYRGRHAIPKKINFATTHKEEECKVSLMDDRVIKSPVEVEDWIHIDGSAPMYPLSGKNTTSVHGILGNVVGSSTTRKVIGIHARMIYFVNENLGIKVNSCYLQSMKPLHQNNNRGRQFKEKRREAKKGWTMQLNRVK
ncbi:hypothetical protein O6H91_14G014200 [Diphasiastrum complanatum]|uniref:Uncharacterized protein n=1 Tax=Diphasiastrum complanatum TaxID=34168 RepID=A0ACC2BLT0_DIPCM|nr:hypothetical protein O6H91_14G014200 [Diphasiastrum complanatum]